MANKIKPIELGTKNIWQLLMQYAIPSVIAMTSSSLYNITDSIFIGKGVGSLAIAGLAITFPLMNLGAAFGAMVGVGASTLMSLRLGQKDYESAKNILGNVFILNLILGSIYMLLVLTFMDPILKFFGASPESLPYAKEYMTVITIGNIITHMYLGLNALLRATGKPKVSMFNAIFSVIINIILTALFIFVFDWGIKGAAWGTVIAQALMLMWQIRIFSDKKEFIHLERKTFRLKFDIVKNSLAIGLSPFLMNAASSLVVIVINQSLSRHGGDLAIGTFGVINRVYTLFPMIVMGLNHGMQPIAGYNFGAKQFLRVKSVLMKTILLATIVLAIGFIVGKFFPIAVSSLFTHDANLIASSAHALSIVVTFFPLLGIQMVTANFFQSIGMPAKAIFLSLTRQVLFLLPLLIILSSNYGVNGVWYSMLSTDFLSSIVASSFLLWQIRLLKKNGSIN